MANGQRFNITLCWESNSQNYLAFPVLRTVCMTPEVSLDRCSKKKEGGAASRDAYNLRERSWVGRNIQLFL